MLTSMERQQSNVERFLKLGYSHADIMRVLDSLKHDAQTNDILEELIKTCQKSTNSSSSTSTSQYASANGHRGVNKVPSGSSKTSRASNSSPQLVARGCSPPRTVSPARSPTPLDRNHSSNFRPVVIDGSNVAMSHGNKQVFSCRGVELAVNWFYDRGMRDITVFVPLWRKEHPRPETSITDQHILTDLEEKNILVFTPSRCVNGKRIVCYDDRYIVKMAYDSDGIIVSNDNYRDLQIEKPQWKKFIEERLLMYTFANDTFMPPEDPLGRNGPTLDNFLRKRPTAPENKQQPCPYGKKCTYGLKCKYYHPERADQSQLSVADELRAKSKSAIEQEQAQHQASMAAASTLHPYPMALSDTGLPFSGYFPGMVPCVGQEDRSSPGLRSSSPRCTGSSAHLHSPLHSYNNGLSGESDGGFGSLERQFSRMSLPHQYQTPEAQYDRSMASSGVGSSSHTSGGFYSSVGHRMGEVGEHFAHPHSGMGLHHAPECCYTPPVSRAAYPALDSLFPPSHLYGHMPGRPHVDYAHDHGVIHASLEKPRHQRLGGSRSLDELGWGQTKAEVEGLVAIKSFEEKRQMLRAQLSNIFPQDTVDHVMRMYPHVQDRTQLVALIQRHKTSF